MTRITSCLLLLLVAACTPPLAERSEAEVRREYLATRTQLAEREGKEWRRFLQEKLSQHRNLLGQAVVEGTITNTATVASYNDVVVQVTFQDANGVVLKQHETPIVTPIAPGQVFQFKEKYPAPKATYSTGYVIADAGFTIPKEL